ncbi:oligopeptide transporter, OPT family [Nitrospirillum sp. BR 11164]|uniref:OPT family oligopeptide transporter n=1 Tax=Nitrospirillum sp. BR 11164 TaxID=3104324 RepID=UPI002AFE000B|nr:oligopeptide transporter, OPT family [Nitrospirillum sp. BR 11164]MEA1649162.1 oligopeptide transporter, OPT family [Nitrospirillum sp. BR 11164]
MTRFARSSIRELTLRGIILGALITVVFTAANVYLGLKVGLTFASSIPAAVISMAVLRLAKDSTIQENNFVQTLASSAGTLSSVIFVLPGLVIVGYWTGFPFWQSAGICAVGGILGVMYTVPLRRAMVVQGNLPYPEGVAAAEVLKVGSPDTAGEAGADEAAKGAGLRDVIAGTLVSIGFFLMTAMRFFTEQFQGFLRIGNAVTGLGTGLSMALLGAGYLVGATVGFAMFVGVAIAWFGAVPILTWLHPPVDGMDLIKYANGVVWRQQVRLIGAGAIAAAAIWTLIVLAKPMTDGIRASLNAMKTVRAGNAHSVPRVEQDIPFHYVMAIAAVLLVPLAGLFISFILGTPLSTHLVVLVLAGVVFAAVMGFIVAAASGYMAGLIGSSNSPISSIGILAAIASSLLLVSLLGKDGVADPVIRAAAVALALFTTSVVLTIATIANDNLQDLKTGQLVGATPWRQQVALVLGCIVGAAVIPPVLNLLQHAYGFAGAPLDPGMDPAKTLGAPQATLMATLATGILSGKLDWSMLGIGAVVGICLVVVDEVLKATTRRFRLPPLAVALGIYLPMTVTVPVSLGALLAYIVDRVLAQRAKAAGVPFEKFADVPQRRAMLLASGMIVGESLFGVAQAAIISLTGNQEPLAVMGDGFAGAAEWLGGAVFLVACLWSVRWVLAERK